MKAIFVHIYKVTHLIQFEGKSVLSSVLTELLTPTQNKTNTFPFDSTVSSIKIRRVFRCYG
jgi:hypothetical protein